MARWSILWVHSCFFVTNNFSVAQVNNYIKQRHRHQKRHRQRVSFRRCSLHSSKEAKHSSTSLCRLWSVSASTSTRISKKKQPNKSTPSNEEENIQQVWSMEEWLRVLAYFLSSRRFRLWSRNQFPTHIVLTPLWPLFSVRSGTSAYTIPVQFCFCGMFPLVAWLRTSFSKMWSESSSMARGSGKLDGRSESYNKNVKQELGMHCHNDNMNP